MSRAVTSKVNSIFCFMTNLIIQAQDSKERNMSSKEIALITGKDHSNVLRDIRNLIEELEKEDSNLNPSDYKVLTLPNGMTGEILLNEDLSLCLGAGYSVVLRMKIIKRWKELENAQQKIPQSKKEWIKLALEQEEKIEQQQLHIGNLSTTLDVLLDWVSIIKVAKHNKISEKSFNWRILKNKSEDLGFSIKKAESPRFGYQNLYHIEAFRACYPQFKYDIK